MEQNISLDISKFFLAGISYKKADAAIRGPFAVDPVQYENILERAPVFNLGSLFILSTCNRTEIYGFGENAAQLINLLCTQTKGAASTFSQLAYVKSGLAAVEHLFHVGAGLDSQILGDYEIVGQLKQSVKFSKDRGFINGFLERLINSVLHTSKIIKNETALSNGTVSVSFAAVQYIKEHIPYRQDKKILVLGAGKIGRITCKNLVDYLSAGNITVINRTERKAAELASDLGLNYAPISQLAGYLANSDIILTCTNADKPIIMRSHLENEGNKLLIDLSIPSNVEPAVSRLSYIRLVNVDELSKVKDETFQKREQETYKAKMIIAEHLATFQDWYEMRKNAPMLKAIKTRLSEIAAIHQRELNNPQTRCPVIAAEQKIQQVINTVAGKMHDKKQAGCHFIEAVNDFLIAVEN